MYNFVFTIFKVTLYWKYNNGELLSTNELTSLDLN
jgi:hypothetical protein